MKLGASTEAPPDHVERSRFDSFSRRCPRIPFSSSRRVPVVWASTSPPPRPSCSATPTGTPKCVLDSAPALRAAKQRFPGRPAGRRSRPPNRPDTDSSGVPIDRPGFSRGHDARPDPEKAVPLVRTSYHWRDPMIHAERRRRRAKVIGNAQNSTQVSDFDDEKPVNTKAAPKIDRKSVV